LGFVLVVVVGVLCAQAFFGVCFLFGLCFLVCLVEVVFVGGFFQHGCGTEPIGCGNSYGACGRYQHS
jgi:hypothetical protein